MSIEVRNITKSFGTFKALDNVSLVFPTGELVALLGPSGSGKTTLLRIISGLEIPDEGSGPILFHEENVATRSVGERKVGFVFQHYALFRHMTVFENIAFGMKVLPRNERPSKEEIKTRVFDLLKLVQLDTQAYRYPSQLSGGQRQRVALARSLAVQPKVLLLDEPFGALDAKVRLELRQWLRKLHDEIHLTSVFVTHDQEEALEVSDRVVVMNNGKIEQFATPREVFQNPATEFVMNFVGTVNLFKGRVEGGKAYFGSVEMDFPTSGGTGSTPANVFVRPHDFEVDTHANGQSSFGAIVNRINAAGPQVKMNVKSDFGEHVDVEISQDKYKELSIEVGSRVFVSPKEIKIFINDYSI